MELSPLPARMHRISLPYLFPLKLDQLVDVSYILDIKKYESREVDSDLVSASASAVEAPWSLSSWLWREFNGTDSVRSDR